MQEGFVGSSFSSSSLSALEASLSEWRRAFALEHGRVAESEDESCRPRVAALAREIERRKRAEELKKREEQERHREHMKPPKHAASFSVLALRSQYTDTRKQDTAAAVDVAVVNAKKQVSLLPIVVTTEKKHPAVDEDKHDGDDKNDDEDFVDCPDLDAAVDGALLSESDDEDAVMAESLAANPVRPGAQQRKRGGGIGALMAAKVRNTHIDGKRALFSEDTPVFKPEDDHEEEENVAAPPKRPNPDRPDKNYRRMNLSGQKKNFRRAGTGKWGSVNNSFVRVQADGSSGGASSNATEDDRPEKEEQTELPHTVLYDPGAALREAAVLREFAAVPPSKQANIEWVSEPSASVDELLLALGHTEFKEGQRQVCEAVVAGKSVLALLPTGGGKSLCYLLPTLAFPGTLTLVVSPLLSLMRDQMARLPPSLKGALLASDQTAQETARQLGRAASGEARILFVAPERVVQPGFRDVLARLPPVRLVCVDEAHCLSMWSHCFRTSYLMLREHLLEPLQPRCVLALTATAVPQTCEQVCDGLGVDEVVRASLLRPNLSLEAVLDPPDPHAALKKLLSTAPVVDMWRKENGRVIVYVNTQRETEQIAQFLTMQSVPCSAYHAGQDPQQRRVTEDHFRSGKVQIVVATVAFGMGIDVSCVRCIVHFDMPKSVENYVQEVGRAGRDGAPALCLCFVSSVQLLRLTSLSYSHSVDARLLRDFLTLVRAQGVGVGAVSTTGKIAHEVGATILAWLQQLRLVRVLPEGHASFLVRFFVAGDHASPVLSWVIANGTKKKKDAEWTSVDACRCAKGTNLTVAQVHEELERLSKAKVIGYKLTDRSFFFDVSER